RRRIARVRQERRASELLRRGEDARRAFAREAAQIRIDRYPGPNIQTETASRSSRRRYHFTCWHTRPTNFASAPSPIPLGGISASACTSASALAWLPRSVSPPAQSAPPHTFSSPLKSGPQSPFPKSSVCRFISRLPCTLAGPSFPLASPLKPKVFPSRSSSASTSTDEPTPAPASTHAETPSVVIASLNPAPMPS